MPGENGTQVALPFWTEQKKTIKSYEKERTYALFFEIKYELSKEKKRDRELLQIEKGCKAGNFPANGVVKAKLRGKPRDP